MTAIAQPRFGVAAAAPARSVAAAVAINPIIRIALYVFVLSIPFEMPDRTIPVEIPTLTGLIFLVTTLLQPSACYRRLPAPLLLFGAYLWVFLFSFMLNGGEARNEAVKVFVTVCMLLVMVWAFINVFADPRTGRGALLALVVACTVRAGLPMLGIATKTYHVYTGGTRVTALGQNLNLSAMILAAGLVAVVGMRLQTVKARPLLHLVAWPLAVLLCVGVMQTGSRGGLVTAAAGILVFALRGRTLEQRVRNVLLGLAGIGALAFFAWQTPMMRARFENAAEHENLAGRERIYPALLGMIRERPFTGWGPVANQYEVAARMAAPGQARRDAHNLVLELLTSTGIIGAIPFLLGLALSMRLAWRARFGRFGLIPCGLLAAMLAGTLSGTWLAAKILWLSIAFAIAAGTFWVAPKNAPEVG